MNIIAKVASNTGPPNFDISGCGLTDDDVRHAYMFIQKKCQISTFQTPNFDISDCGLTDDDVRHAYMFIYTHILSFS